MSYPNSQKSFWYLIATQFQGAFSDNAYKNIVTLVAVSTAVTAQQESQRISLAGTLFILPFLLFSMYGGFLADRFSKRSVTIYTKVAEVAIMLLATLELSRGHLSLAMGLLFLTGSQAAFFGPTKYGILPELLPEKRLSWGNGILEMTTFLSIILGTVGGAILVEHLGGRLYLAGLILVVLALVGTATSLGIGRLPAANPAARFRWNFVGEVWRYVRLAREDRVLWLAVVGGAYFWFLGFLFQTNIILYGKNSLGLQESHIGYLLSSVALGIGLGSYVAGHLSGNKIEYGLIPLGSIGITVFSLILGLGRWDFWHSSGSWWCLGARAGGPDRPARIRNRARHGAAFGEPIAASS